LQASVRTTAVPPRARPGACEAGQLSLFEGRRRRDYGIKTVADNEHEVWRQAYREIAAEFLNDLTMGDVFIAEDLRIAVTRSGAGTPHHFNCWGAMANLMLRAWLKKGRICHAGSEQSRLVTSHAHRNPSYRKLK
jgi:hypothetical protein